MPDVRQPLSPLGNEEEAESLGGKFLGIGYCPRLDVLEMKINPIIRTSSGKRGRQDTYLEATEAVTENILEGLEQLTRRAVTSFMAAQYDPLGCLSPILLVGKLLLRKLHGKEVSLSWDDPLPLERAQEWGHYIQKLLALGTITFPRSIRPEYGREAWIISFWDGSTDAHSASIYCRWAVKDSWEAESVTSNLVIAKSRVSPISGSTVPRMELQGLLMATRLLRRVLDACLFHVTRVIIAGDSMCAILATQKDGINFKQFFQNRLCEIQENLDYIKKKVDGNNSPFYMIGYAFISS